MKTLVRSIAVGLFIVVVALTAGLAGRDGAGWAQEPAASVPIGSSFMYQGRLIESSRWADGVYDFQFRLYDAPQAGAALGPAVVVENVQVRRGLFTAALDFGAGALYAGRALYLEVGVRPGDSSGPFTVLQPRQPLAPAPLALALPGLWTLPAGDTASVVGGYAGNSVGPAALGAVVAGGGTAGAPNQAYASFAAVGGGRGNRAEGEAAVIAGGAENQAAGYGASVPGGAGNRAGGAYSLAAGRRAQAGYDGSFVWADSTDADFAASAPDQFAVRAGGGVSMTLSGGGWSLLPDSLAPAIVGGTARNHVQAGASGAVIAGGGRPAQGTEPASPNAVTDWFGAVGGGAGNRAGNDNDVATDAGFATVAGGEGNVASGRGAAVAGGTSNVAEGIASSVAGGLGNRASGGYALVAGGHNNQAGGDWSAVLGGYGGRATGANATVAGGVFNAALGDFSFAAGRRAQAKHAGAFVWADSQDEDLLSTAQDQFLARAGGGVHLLTGNGAWRLEPGLYSPNVIGGYGGNSADAGMFGGVIAGGGNSGSANRLVGNYAAVGGGSDNQSNHYATVAGGWHNRAQGHGSTVGGGWSNVAGGGRATVAGGEGNGAAGLHASVGGGMANQAAGASATVPGGEENLAAGDYSFAAGRRAKALHAGSFVWSDSTGAELSSSAPDQFLVRAGGGMTVTAAAGARFDVNAGAWLKVYSDTGRLVDTSTGAYLSSGGAWTNASDRALKEDFAPAQPQEVLARLVQMPIATWSYKAETPAVRHLGPTAQDFYAAFGLGADERAISTGDADGVALAAIQGLYQAVQERDARLAGQQQRLDDMERRLAALETASRPAPPGSAAGWGVAGLLAGLILGWRMRRRAAENR